jgi:hypothetical protein
MVGLRVLVPSMGVRFPHSQPSCTLRLKTVFYDRSLVISTTPELQILESCHDRVPWDNTALTYVTGFLDRQLSEINEKT